jgi:predicted RND superfamily exporter protein
MLGGSFRSRAGRVGGAAALAIFALFLLFFPESRPGYPDIFRKNSEAGRPLRTISELLGTDLAPITIYLSPRAAPKGLDQLLFATRSLSGFVERMDGVTHVISFAPLIEEAIAKKPELMWGHVSVEKFSSMVAPPELARFVDLKGEAVRMVVLFRPMSVSETAKRLALLEHYGRTMLPGFRIDFGGPSYLFHRAARDAASGFAVGFLATALAIFGLLAFALRRAYLVFVAIIVNLVPVAVVSLVMAWTQTPMTLGLLALPILLSVAVDDTIQILWPLRRGVSMTRLLRVGQHTGPALMAATAMLAGVFLTLLGSELSANVDLAWLLAIGLTTALLCDLLLLPALLAAGGVTESRPRRST